LKHSTYIFNNKENLSQIFYITALATFADNIINIKAI